MEIIEINDKTEKVTIEITKEEEQMLINYAVNEILKNYIKEKTGE